MEDEKTILLQLRQGAMNCSDQEYRWKMLSLADNLQLHISALYNSPTPSNMTSLNGLWVQAVWMIEKMPKESPPGGSGLKEEARLAA